MSYRALVKPIPPEGRTLTNQEVGLLRKAGLRGIPNHPHVSPYRDNPNKCILARNGGREPILVDLDPDKW